MIIVTIQNSERHHDYCSFLLAEWNLLIKTTLFFINLKMLKTTAIGITSRVGQCTKSALANWQKLEDGIRNRLNILLGIYL
jgi:hypothetical protein